MNQTCKQCGTPIGADSENCYLCQPLASAGLAAYRVRNGGLVRASWPLAAVPDWRTEVSQRLEQYRSRRQRLQNGFSQPELAFVGEDPARTPAASRPRWQHQAPVLSQSPLPPRSQRIERIEIDLLQPPLDFSGASPAQTGAPGQAFIAPCASLRERRLAALLDCLLILSAYGVFLSLFVALGGRFVFSKLDAAILAATLGLFYTQYFTLFMLFGGATPGMSWRGLHLASFNGGPPSPGALAWRSFGYFISAAALMMGFLWCLWDEDRLCWHDRISQTHLSWEPRAATSGLFQDHHGTQIPDFYSR